MCSCRDNTLGKPKDRSGRAKPILTQILPASNLEKLEVARYRAMNYGFVLCKSML
jgi:hypothetical protein